MKVHPKKLVKFDATIHDMELSRRISNLLRKGGVTTLPMLARKLSVAKSSSRTGDIDAYDMNIDKFGDGSLRILERELADLGWSFDMLIEEHRRRQNH